MKKKTNRYASQKKKTTIICPAMNYRQLVVGSVFVKKVRRRLDVRLEKKKTRFMKKKGSTRLHFEEKRPSIQKKKASRYVSGQS